MKEFKFKLGSLVQDKVTGFQGVVRVRSQYLTGCNTYALQNPKLDKDGKPADWVYIDETLLIEIQENGLQKKDIKRSITGGPQNRNQCAPEI